MFYTIGLPRPEGERGKMSIFILNESKPVRISISIKFKTITWMPDKLYLLTFELNSKNVSRF